MKKTTAMLLVAAVIGMLASCSRGQNTGSQTNEEWPNRGDVCILSSGLCGPDPWRALLSVEIH